MIEINKIYEKPGILEFLEKRNLKNQYIKSAKLLLNGFIGKTDFKIRNPKKYRIYSFRINKQFRALCTIDENKNLLVFKIDNHQN